MSIIYGPFHSMMLRIENHKEVQAYRLMDLEAIHKKEVFRVNTVILKYFRLIKNYSYHIGKQHMIMILEKLISTLNGNIIICSVSLNKYLFTDSQKIYKLKS